MQLNFDVSHPTHRFFRFCHRSETHFDHAWGIPGFPNHPSPTGPPLFWLPRLPSSLDSFPAKVWGRDATGAWGVPREQKKHPSNDKIRRPRPSPRPGRRLGPPEVWILSFLNPCHAQRCRQKPPQGHSNGSRAPHGRSNGFFSRRSRLPFARPQTLQTFQLLQKFAHLRRETVPQQAQHAPLPHAKATTRPQQWLKGTPRPQQWLLIGVQGCGLPGLKPSKRSKSPPSSAGKRYPNKPNTRHSLPRPTLQAKATTRPQQWLKGGVHPPAAAMAIRASYRRSRPQQWLKGTPRSQQWLLF